MHFFGTLISECWNPSSCRLRKDELHEAYHASSYPGIGQKNCKRMVLLVAPSFMDYASNPGTVGMLFEAAVMYGDRHPGDNDALENLDPCTASTSFPAPLVAIQCVIAFLCRPTWFRLSQIVQIVSQCFMTRNSHRFTTFSLLHRSRLSYKEHNTCISSQQFKTFYKAYGIISHSPTDAYCLIFILCCGVNAPAWFPILPWCQLNLLLSFLLLKCHPSVFEACARWVGYNLNPSVSKGRSLR